MTVPKWWVAIGVFGTALGTSSVAMASEPEPYLAAERGRYANAEGPVQPLDNDRWWTRFGDASLDDLVARGLDRNYDLEVADARIRESRAVVKQNLAPLLPTVTWDSTFNVAPTDSLGFQFGGTGGGPGMGGDPPELYWTASSTLNAAIEIDLTGRNVLAMKAAKDDVRASGDDRDQQAVAVAANIVGAYYDVVTAQAQLEVVEGQVETNEKLLELTKLRLETGQANAVDVLQQRQQLQSTRTLVPQARTQLATFQHQLAVLLAETPGTSYAVSKDLPGALPPSPAIGSPGDLARSRPDVRAARARLEASTRRTKSARRQYAPSLRISGNYGAQAIGITDVNDQLFWGAGATLSVPIYQGGLVRGRVKQAEAQQRTATYQVSTATLNAMREVEDALVREAQQKEALEAYVASAQAAHDAFDESRRRYADGVGDYLPVLTSLNAAQQADLNVITARRDLIAARVQLHQALGDGGVSLAPEGPQ